MKFSRALCGMLLPALLGAEAANAQSEPIAQARQLTHSYNLDNSISPDGQRIVFIKILEGREQLFVMSRDGSGEKQITRIPADHEDPAWSPDGNKIAYVLIRNGRKVVHLMNPDGSSDEALTPASQSAIHPSWSPDGGRILYCTDDDLRPPVKNESQIHVIDIATRKVASLIAGGVNTYPAMSPDGMKIAFRKIIGEMNSEVFVANADGSGLRNLTNHWSYEGWPAWSPDGRRIAFAGNRNANYQFFVMNADGSNVRLLANSEGRATVPRWSPDGQTIYFTNCQKRDFGRACEIMQAGLEDAR